MLREEVASAHEMFPRNDVTVSATTNCSYPAFSGRERLRRRLGIIFVGLTSGFGAYFESFTLAQPKAAEATLRPEFGFDPKQAVLVVKLTGYVLKCWELYAGDLARGSSRRENNDETAECTQIPEYVGVRSSGPGRGVRWRIIDFDFDFDNAPTKYCTGNFFWAKHH